MPRDRGVFHLLPENPVHPKWRGLLCSFFFLLCTPRARQLATCAPARKFTTALFPVTSWQLFALCAPHPSLYGTIRQGFNPLLPDSNHTCSHDVTLHIPKQAPRFEGLPTRAHALCLSITCAVRPANRTHCAGHMELHTHTRLENPSVPNPYIQPSFCPSRDRQHPPRAFPDRVSLAQPSTRQPRAQHGMNLVLAAVQTRRGSQNNYGRYSAFPPPPTLNPNSLSFPSPYSSM